MKTKPLTFILHCYGRPSRNGHIAVCLELDLMTKGKNPHQAKEKLLEQIRSYVEGLNDENFNDLFPRNAPTIYYFDYYRVKTIVDLQKFRRTLKDQYQYFLEELRPRQFRLLPA